MPGMTTTRLLRRRDLGIAHEVGEEVALLLRSEGLQESFRHERDGQGVAPVALQFEYGQNVNEIGLRRCEHAKILGKA